MARFLGYTTQPTGRRLTAWRRYWHGDEVDEEAIEPGFKDFTARFGFSRAYAELYHDAALRRGFESQLSYFDDAWEVRVRRPGDQGPSFIDDPPK